MVGTAQERLCPPYGAPAGTTRIVLATHRARSFAIDLALENQRARGRPGARRTRGLMGDMGSKCCPRAYRFGGNTPAFPAQWLYGLYEIALVTLLFVTP